AASAPVSPCVRSTPRAAATSSPDLSYQVVVADAGGGPAIVSAIGPPVRAARPTLPGRGGWRAGPAPRNAASDPSAASSGCPGGASPDAGERSRGRAVIQEG